MTHPATINNKPACPPNLEYYPYQEEGILFARGKEKVLIGDEMGLGKTPQAIGILNDNPSYKSVLIICPSVIKINWERELDTWLCNRDLTIKVVNGSGLPSEDVVIMNYEKLSKANIRNREWDMIIIDEAHYIKNDKATRTREIMGFREKTALKAKKIVMLTGTPMTNRPQDMWTICRFMSPDVFKSKWAYLHRYCLDANPKKHMMFGRWDFTKSNNEAELAEKLKPFMIRRFKRDVLTQLPPKRYHVVELQPTGMQKALIKEENSLVDFTDGLVKVKVDFKDIARVREELGALKAPVAAKYLGGVLEEYDGKIVVFAHHRRTLEYLKEHFQTKACLVYGGLSDAQKQAEIDSFTDDDSEVRIFLGSISSAGIGINLTNASKTFFVEMDYVPAKMRQAEDRTHRATQKSDSVDIHYLVFRGSIDANIAWSLVNKEEVIDKVVGV
jgi:SNF2 family DNA or RNA helicase